MGEGSGSDENAGGAAAAEAMASAYAPAIAVLARLGGASTATPAAPSAVSGAAGAVVGPFTAADKLATIAEAMRVAQGCAAAFHAGTGRNTAMAAEELLPVLAFLTARAQLPAAGEPASDEHSDELTAASVAATASRSMDAVGCWLHAEAAMLNAFVPEHLLHGEHGYCLISLVSTLSLLDGLAATLAAEASGTKNEDK